MTFLIFQKQFENYPAFSRSDIEIVFPKFDNRLLSLWQKKELIEKIRNRWYRFPKELGQPLRYFISNQIYAPSYISLESALSFYGLIPEGVFSITSISTKKTNEFKTPTGHFLYKKIKPDFFYAYRLIEFSERKDLLPFNFKIAEPEKAIIDFLYFNPNYKTKDDFLSLRINEGRLNDLIDWKKMEKHLQYFNSEVLWRRYRKFKKTYYAKSA